MNRVGTIGITIRNFITLRVLCTEIKIDPISCDGTRVYLAFGSINNQLYATRR